MTSDSPQLQVFVVDDSVIYRRILCDVIKTMNDVEIVGTAENGKVALEKLQTTPADLVLLDVEMPVMNGLETLNQIRAHFPRMGVVMVSALNQYNADVTIQALQAGAYDFIPKPDQGNASTNREELRYRLQPIFRHFDIRKHARVQRPASGRKAEPLPGRRPMTEKPTVASGEQPPSASEPAALPTPKHLPIEIPRPAAAGIGAASSPTATPSVSRSIGSPAVPPPPPRDVRPPLSQKPPSIPDKPPAPQPRPRVPGAFRKVDVLAIGVSTGGPSALADLLPTLPANLGVPIVIVQHMPPLFTASLAASLDRQCAFKVKEAVDGEPVLPDVAYLAPGGRHMVLAPPKPGEFHPTVRLTDDPPVNSCRPAVDILFQSLAQVYTKNVLSVVLTGMGRDGTDGVARLKQTPNACYCIAQSEGTCVVYGMPRSVVEANLADEVLDLDQIGARIHSMVRGK
jgi:two-component system chemotaxis response regulator CheB